MDHLIQMKDKEPEIGFKFVAFYNDSSGSEIVLRHDQGYIDTEGEDTAPTHWGSWIRLPDDFPLWFERNDID